MRLNLSSDELLSTTRAVRKRLDFDRSVPKELLVECLELAFQAPTGSNSQGFGFVVVDDPAKKLAIAELYGKAFDAYANSPAPKHSPLDPRTKSQAGVKDSATYLRENFHRSPYMVIPVIRGRIETPGALSASAYGSILPSFWSFMLAARERSLGTAWTTLHLLYEKEVAEILDIPFDSITQCGLTPLAYTIGTDFKPAPRLELDTLVHWNTW